MKLGLPGGQFGQPVALTIPEIEEIVRRFGVCAAAVKAAGFTGVQVHAAHGYLLSEFLSPRSNLRTDRYGGELANRARALLEAVAAVRAAVGPDFPVAVKLNSADFQKGGFAFEDSLQVAAVAGTGQRRPDRNFRRHLRAAQADGCRGYRGSGGTARGQVHHDARGLLCRLRPGHAGRRYRYR